LSDSHWVTLPFAPCTFKFNNGQQWRPACAAENTGTFQQSYSLGFTFLAALIYQRTKKYYRGLIRTRETIVLKCRTQHGLKMGMLYADYKIN